MNNREEMLEMMKKQSLNKNKLILSLVVTIGSFLGALIALKQRRREWKK
ncbi:hypothetical protein [Niallia sp. 01092]